MKVTLLVLTLVFTTLSWGQSSGNLTSEWQLLQEQNGVQLFAKQQGCNLSQGLAKPFDIAFLKIVNNTNSEKTVSYNFVIQFTEGCTGCNDELESFFMQKVPANSSIEEDCNFRYSGMAHIIGNPNFSGAWHFEKVSITNFKLD